MAITQITNLLDNLIQFKTVKWEDNPLYPEDVKSKVQKIPISKIVSHQNAVKRHIVEEYKKKPGRDLPMLHKIGGKYFVEDGNHRIVAKKEKGEKTVRARVFEKELIAILDDLIEFANNPNRGAKIAFRTAKWLHHAPVTKYHDIARSGLLALPPGLTSPLERGKRFKALVPPYGTLAASNLAQKVKLLRSNKVWPFRGMKGKTIGEFAVVLDDLIQFSDKKKLHQPTSVDEPPQELPVFKEGELLDYNVQQHHAKRAGLHRDVRIGNRHHGLLSWATRKDLPAHGQKIAIHQQPTHRHSYLGWEGEIPSGYGAGTVKSEDLGKALVTKSTPGELHATLADRKGSHRLAFIKTKAGWLHTKAQPVQPPEGAHKPAAKSLSPSEAKGYLSRLESGSSVQPKVDGALVYVSTAGGRPEILSHRVSKVTGMHPVHTERVFRGRPTIDIPREHQRTLIAELYGKVRGKSIEPQTLGGLLNAHIGESIRKQKASGVKLKVMPFDVAGHHGSYPERLSKLKETLRHLPKDVFHAPVSAESPGAALRLYDKIRSGRHSLTKEGVIIHPPQGKMIKVKHTKETNVKIAGTFPGTGKFHGAPGGFTYADSSGRTIGKVGTGFTDETRRDLEKYVGRTARVRHQGKYPSGALRAPSFIAVDEGK